MKLLYILFVRLLGDDLKHSLSFQLHRKITLNKIAVLLTEWIKCYRNYIKTKEIILTKISANIALNSNQFAKQDN